MNHRPILVNGRYQFAPPTGVQRYARNVSTRLDLPVRVVAPSRSLGRWRGHLWEQWVLPRQSPARALLWSPANTGPLRVHNQVVTIHDLAALEHPEWFARSFVIWYRWLLPRLAQRVSRVITVSQFSKVRLQAVLHLPAGQIAVAPPGIGPEFSPALPEAVAAVQSKYRLEAPYFLWVGTLEPRKNLPGLLQAWRASQPDTGNTELILCGSRQQNFRHMRLEPLPAGVRSLGHVPDADLPGLYTGALALLLPSFYEGFGLPALEALACGTPAIVSSQAGICTEIEAGVLPINPLDTASLAAAIVRLWQDADLRRKLGDEGREVAGGFGWERAAAITDAVLRQVADEAEK